MNNQYHLSIQDTGYGIPEKELENIFERFTRLERTAEQLGSGLGLAVVKELIQVNKGKIEVSSQLNRGTTFTVTFPLISNVDESKALEIIDSPSQVNPSTELFLNQVEDSLTDEKISGVKAGKPHSSHY